MFVYSFYAADGTALYIGQAKQVLTRYEQHCSKDAWMKHVKEVMLRGPYPLEKVNFYEQIHIAEEQPLYNCNSRYIDEPAGAVGDPYPCRRFDTVEDFVAYCTLRPDTYQRGTYYLRVIDLEVLRTLQFYLRYDISELVREALEIGMGEMARRIGHDDIYAEVLETMINAEVMRKNRVESGSHRRFHPTS